MKVALYCRLSEEDRDKINPSADSESIQNQKSILINHALEQGWDIYNIYSDDDYAGSDRNRPAFKQLIADAEKKCFNIILCKTQSRFTRELELVEKYIHGLFLEWNIRFVGLADNADTDNKGNKKSRQINGLVNEWYLEDLSDNIKSVLRNKCRDGQHIGGFALYGYKKDDEKKNHLIIDDEAAEIVKQIYELYLQGNGCTKISNILNNKHIPNPSAYKRINGSNFKPAKRDPRGDMWSYTTVSTMLRNQMYVGDMVQHRTEKVSYKSSVARRVPRKDWIVVSDTHEAIISREEWENVQLLINTKSKPYKSGQVHILAGKCKCADCGKILSSNHAKGKKYLRCATHDISKELCSGATIRQDIIEQIVLEKINQISSDSFDLDYIDKNVEITEGLESKLERLSKRRTEIEKKIKELENLSKNAYVDKINGIITTAQFSEFNNMFLKEIEDHKAAITLINHEYDAFSIPFQQAKSKIEKIEKYKNVSQLTRLMVLDLIDEIRVGVKDVETKKIPIEIHWNF